MNHHSLEYYRSRLRISKNRLDDELEDHAELSEQISNAVATLTTAMLVAKDELSRVEARLAEDFRDGDAKMTLSQIDGAVKQHRERISAMRHWMEARELQEQWQGLERAWKSRNDNLRALGNLFSSHYFTVRSVGARQEDLREAYEQRRAQIREASTTRRRVIE